LRNTGNLLNSILILASSSASLLFFLSFTAISILLFEFFSVPRNILEFELIPIDGSLNITMPISVFINFGIDIHLDNISSSFFPQTPPDCNLFTC
jgi:hypothetical protein